MGVHFIDIGPTLIRRGERIEPRNILGMRENAIGLMPTSDEGASVVVVTICHELAAAYFPGTRKSAAIPTMWSHRHFRFGDGL
ncbi:hypothetical protein CO251_04420 [Sulfobacillus sp. hq2]|nr:hypothetical protein CO251_04420 [Sulfobacillus sp. hq2]